MAWMKKLYLGVAIVAACATEYFPAIAPEMLVVAVFFSIFSVAGGLDLTQRIYKLEEEVELLKKAADSGGK